jgi:hypothetical protein
MKVIVYASTKGSESKVLTCRKDGIDYDAPAVLAQRGFPVCQSFFPFDAVSDDPGPTAANATKAVKDIASSFHASHRDSVMFSLGTRKSLKREFMFGKEGVVWQVTHTIASAAVVGSIYQVNCYVLRPDDTVRDLIDWENSQGIIVDSLRDGTRVKQIEKFRIRSPADVATLSETIQKNIALHWEGPEYRPDSIIFTLARYDTQSELDAMNESNSIHFVCLGDADRPLECGVDALSSEAYAKTQRTLSAVISVLSSLRYHRIRIPFAKAKLTLLLKRSYVIDKARLFDTTTRTPTTSYLIVHAANTIDDAEESYHVLSSGKRIVSIIGSGIGPASRDVTVDKWRMEMDTMAVHERLAAACRQYTYTPSIYGVIEPNKSIQEEEEKHFRHIQKKHSEIRERAVHEMKKRCLDEAKQIAVEYEKLMTAAPKDRDRLAERRQAVEGIVRSYREKKEKFEATVARNNEEIDSVEAKIKAAQDNIARQKKHLDMLANASPRASRKAILAERESAGEQDTERKDAIFNQLSDMYGAVIEKHKGLIAERAGYGLQEGLYDAITEIDRQLISSNAPVPIPMEAISEDYGTMFRQVTQAITSEKAATEERLKAALAVPSEKRYAAPISADLQSRRVLSDHFVPQLIAYIHNGTCLYKVPTKSGQVKRRYYYIPDDNKSINVVELNDIGIPLDPKKPALTIPVKDIVRIILGQCTDVFREFIKAPAPEGAKGPAEVDGFRFAERTPTGLNPTNMSKYFHRSFSLEMKKNKTLNLVADSDEDMEAWVVGLMQLKVPIAYGCELDLTGRDRTSDLTPGEVKYCQLYHALPWQVLALKQNLVRLGTVTPTVSDIRTLSSLDWWQSVNYLDAKKTGRL